MVQWKRRDFLKAVGLTGASAITGCSSESAKKLIPYVIPPDDIVPGTSTWFATTCRECPAGCGALAKNREGRVIKVEGNPLHPINQGSLCLRGQASVQGIYNPDRLKAPLLKEEAGWRSISFSQAEALLTEKIQETTNKGKNRVRILTEVVGESLFSLFASSLERWNSPDPVIFEPYAYESLKTAQKTVFGVKGIPSLRMEEADVVVSFGADFLETWLSPVEYARKFKAMHSLHDGIKGFFGHISPYQSLTGSNADLWLSCVPGGEAAIALGLLKAMLQLGKGKDLPEPAVKTIEGIVAPMTKEKVLQLSGSDLAGYQRVLNRLANAQNPLVLGAGTGNCGENSVLVDMAVLLLNLVLSPDLPLFDFNQRHRVELASSRSEVINFFEASKNDPVELLILNNVNPVFSLPPACGIADSLREDSLFVVSFNNFLDETAELSDLIFPVALPLETWDEYSGKRHCFSTLQPAMESLTGAPHLGDIFLGLTTTSTRGKQDYRTYLRARFLESDGNGGESEWLEALQKGGTFTSVPETANFSMVPRLQVKPDVFADVLASETNRLLASSKPPALTLIAAPSIRFFDGRGANKPWLCEIPDPLTKVAWQTPVLAHPKTLREMGLCQEHVVCIQSAEGDIEAPLYETPGVMPGVLVLGIGQGHTAFGRYAKGRGINPLSILPAEPLWGSGGASLVASAVSIRKTGRVMKLAHTDGSRVQHARKIALSINLQDLGRKKAPAEPGLSMNDFPFTLPLPEGYNRERDFYPPHDHVDYRWAMVVDLDKCIGCGACMTACYAENNLGVVGEERMLEGREMAWLQVQRYEDPQYPARITFLPMLCQHCDDAPCESVCPVFAPHHSKEGINNQIYNRCIGTRFCSQDCPYKVRRFNWFDWQWPKPLNLQLNPDVTVRSKGVMEKCSFCVQRIKEAHGRAKNENRKIHDGEIQPACLQTCPTGVFTFGNLMDKASKVRKLVENERAYQIMGYLNTKPAVIYLKKVVQTT